MRKCLRIKKSEKKEIKGTSEKIKILNRKIEYVAIGVRRKENQSKGTESMLEIVI